MGTICQSAAAIFEAGIGISTDLIEADYDFAIDHAEGLINAVSRTDWVSKFSGLTQPSQDFLERLCAKIAGIDLIAFDMRNHASIRIPEDKMNILRDSKIEGLSILRDQKVVTFLGGN